MNLKLNEWNISCAYANKVCENLKNKGYNVRLKPYSMSNGNKGVYLQVFDAHDKFFKQYATGIHNTLSNMKNAIDSISIRIVTEC